jgi:thiamine pyrophosphate-dependent acetolactate synthase large subunit-like protein
MNRAEAIRAIVARHPDAAIIFCNGLISREASFVADRPGNLYLLHAMGEALSVGIGLRLARPDIEVVVVDGDGNAVMGLAACTLLPRQGLHYYVLVNNTYETTGSQPTPALTVEHAAMKKRLIEEGTIGAPLPPKPEEIRENFMSWLFEKEHKRRRQYGK